MKHITEAQLHAYAAFGDDEYTDFSSYRDCAHLAREVLRLRAALAKRKK